MPPSSFPHSRMTTRSFLQHVGVQGHPGVLLGFNASNAPSLFFGSPGQTEPPRPPGPSINFPEQPINFPEFPGRPPGPPGATAMPPVPPEINYGHPPWAYTQPPAILMLRDSYAADPKPFTGQDPTCLEEFVASCILKFTSKLTLFFDDGSRVNMLFLTSQKLLAVTTCLEISSIPTLIPTSTNMVPPYSQSITHWHLSCLSSVILTLFIAQLADAFHNSN